MEFLEEFVLPLFRKTAGADDKTAPEVAARKEFLDEEAGHDGLARTGVVRKDVAQGQAAQHFLIDSGNLMWQRLDIAGVDGEIRVEVMGVVYTPRFRSEAELCTVGVETPRQGGVLKRELPFILAVEDTVAKIAPAVFVGKIQNDVAVPLDCHNGDCLMWINAKNKASACEIFESHHFLPPRRRWRLSVLGRQGNFCCL